MGQGLSAKPQARNHKNDRFDALHDLLPFVQFKKRQKHPEMSGTFSKVKNNTPPWVLSTSFKLYNWLTNGGKHHYIPDKKTSRTVKTDLAQSEAGDSKYLKKTQQLEYLKNLEILWKIVVY